MPRPNQTQHDKAARAKSQLLAAQFFFKLGVDSDRMFSGFYLHK